MLPLQTAKIEIGEKGKEKHRLSAEVPRLRLQHLSARLLQEHEKQVAARMCVSVCEREFWWESSSCLSDSPRTAAPPVGHSSLSSVSHQSESTAALQRKLWLPEGPLLFSELISKQKRGGGSRPHFRRRGSSAAGSLIFLFACISTGNTRASQRRSTFHRDHVMAAVTSKR